jgi:hypothetical protein
MTYMGGPYYPWWLDNLTDDVTGFWPRRSPWRGRTRSDGSYRRPRHRMAHPGCGDGTRP